jgi:hypothetical protein
MPRSIVPTRTRSAPEILPIEKGSQSSGLNELFEPPLNYGRHQNYRLEELSSPT